MPNVVRKKTNSKNCGKKEAQIESKKEGAIVSYSKSYKKADAAWNEEHLQ